MQVTNNGSIQTALRDAHGIVAQSIGGGGLTVGGNLVGGCRGDLRSACPANTGNGNAGPMTVLLGNGANIATQGDGAYGIIAQSVGGGGSIAGDLSKVTSVITPPRDGIVTQAGTGNGGNVKVDSTNASITTTGAYAPATFAQSVGGGGLLAINSTWAAVQSGGTGVGGDVVAVTLTNSHVSASGLNSPAIVIQNGTTAIAGGASIVTIDAPSTVSGGNHPSRSLYFSHSQAAISFLSAGGNVLNNAVPGILNPGPRIELGAGCRLNNAGTLHVGGIGAVGQTTITGDLVQAKTGTLVVDVAAGGVADHLQVNGKAVLDGMVIPVVSDPANLRPGAKQLSVLTATDGITQNGVRVGLNSPVVRYGVSAADANTLALNYNVDYSASDALRAEGLFSSNRSEVGRALNTILTNDAPAFSALQTLLVNAATAQNVATLLDAVFETAAASAQQTTFAAQQVFTSTISRHLVRESVGGAMGPYATASLDPVPGPPANDTGVRVWVGGFGASDVLRGRDGQGSLHSQVAGAQLGVDKWFDADRMLGVSVGG